MIAEISWNDGSLSDRRTVDLPDDESGFWRGVSELLVEVPIPCRMQIECELGGALLEVCERGCWYEDGVAKPSMYVREGFNGIKGLSPSSYEKRYLVCVNPESKGGEGSYKFYELEQSAEAGKVTARYGPFEGHRGARGTVTYESWLYWIRYAEKLTKGYRDRSREYLGDKVGRTGGETERAQAVDRSTASGRLYATLIAMAEGCCRANLRCGVDVTVEMAREARRCLNNMAMSKKLATFNKWARSLMEVSPRSAHTVSAFFANSESDFAKILMREEGLVAAMEAVASSKGKAKARRRAVSFDDFGIEVREVALADAPLVLDSLKGTPLAKVRRVYEVVPKAQRARYEEYRSSRGIADDAVRYLWHGSRNENWSSIMERSLMLNPVSAVRTGAMFGPGIYFAPSCEKSWNYTSFRGTYWASGRSDTAFMGLFECAYGDPWVVQSAGRYDLADLDARGKDCVHAYAGCSGLRNEEIVFYSEAAMCMRYLVEFGD